VDRPPTPFSSKDAWSDLDVSEFVLVAASRAGSQAIGQRIQIELTDSLH
jgi:uncharacterized protein (DUF1778 family)